MYLLMKYYIWLGKDLPIFFLEDQTIFQYKCDASYHPESEECIIWNDPSLGIEWGIKNPIVSSKDQEGKLFKDVPLNELFTSLDKS